jgi:hypothetical protein
MEMLFCYNPELRKLPEPSFEQEYDAARECGFVCRLFGFEDFLAGKAGRAFERLPPGEGKALLYRGWILSEGEYRLLDAALQDRGYALFTPPAAYAEALYLPNHYPRIAAWCPPAVWTEGPDLDRAWRAARSLGAGPWIVKDHIKSAKQRWHSACFLPRGSDRATFDEVCRNFLAYRGEHFARGFVFKQYVPLARLGETAFGSPLCEEYRLFFWKHDLLAAAPYDRLGGSETDFARYAAVARRFRSQFLTIDVARTAAGGWLILEAGDGGVSALPPGLPATAFYRALRERLVACGPRDGPGRRP